jgi:hypothetical protein
MGYVRIHYNKVALVVDLGDTPYGKLKFTFQYMHNLFVVVRMFRDPGTFLNIPERQGHVSGVNHFAMITRHDFPGRNG